MMIDLSCFDHYFWTYPPNFVKCLGLLHLVNPNNRLIKKKGDNIGQERQETERREFRHYSIKGKTYGTLHYWFLRGLESSIIKDEDFGGLKYYN